MTNFEPNRDILLVYGDNIFEGYYRLNLKNYLHSSDAATASSPVLQGTHDFWVTYGSTGSPKYSMEDMKIKLRPLRGIVEMGGVPMDATRNTKTIQQQIATLLQ